VEQAVVGENEPLFTAITPFDIYTGEKIPVGKKSLAIALTFRHGDRTLMTEEVTEALGRIVTRLRELAGAEIRS
jgi:phenylalanyl-tRNA synthetase beta chain